MADDIPKLRMAPPEPPKDIERKSKRKKAKASRTRKASSEESPAQFRIGSVKYLNAVPLTRGIEGQVIFAEPAKLARGEQEPPVPERPASAAVQVRAADQARGQPRHGHQVLVGELGVQDVEIELAVAGQGVPLAGEDPVQPVTEQGEARVAQPREVVPVGLGVALERSPGGRRVRPADAGEHAGGEEFGDDLFLFAHVLTLHLSQ